MKFGIFFELSVPRPFTPTNESEVYFNALEQIRLADELGFDTAWAVEHHFFEEYAHCSAPELFLTAAAMQVAVDYHLTRAERYLPLLNDYDAAAWGEPRVEPNYPVVASGGGGDLEIKPLRFAGRPEELVFTGTEKVT